MTENVTPASNVEATSSAPINTPAVNTAISEVPASLNAKVSSDNVLSITVDGEVETYDMSNPTDKERAVKALQKAKGADKRFQEGASMRKQAEEFITLLKTNPRAVLSDPSIGIDMRKFAEDYLMEQLQDEMMDPKDKELRNTKAELAKYEAEKKKIADEATSKENEALTQQYIGDLTKNITAALDANPDLPKTNYTIGRIAYYMQQGLARGMDLQPKDVVDLVKNDFYQSVQHTTGAASIDVLVKMLGADKMKAIREYDLKQLRSPGTVSGVEVKKAEDTNKPKSKKITMDEFQKDFRSKYGEI